MNLSMKHLPLVLLLAALPTLGAYAQSITVIAPNVPSVAPAVADAAARAAIKPIAAKKIILVGDSTTQVGSGWGGSFCANHLTSFVACINLARGGRGTFDYRAEGSWDLVLAEMRAPGYRQVYVLIQFGHNDQPGKPGRSTDLRHEFPDNLRRYVSEARSTGAIPVMLTPLTRRAFKNGSLQDDLELWAQAVRQVAGEMNVPLVDLHAVSSATVQAMGPVPSLSLAETSPPQYVIDAAAKGTTVSVVKPSAPSASAVASPITSTEILVTPQGHPTVVFDYTHLGPKGADLFSKQVAIELSRVVPDLRKDLVEELYPPSN